MTDLNPLDDTVTPVYSYRHQFNDVIGVIRNYTPRAPKRFWRDDVQEFTRSAVTELKPVTETNAAAYLSAVAQIAIWTTQIACLPLKRNIVFDKGNIDRFIHDTKAMHTPAQLDSKKFRLYRVGREFGTNVPPVFSDNRKKWSNFFAPYSPREMIRFRNQAASRSTAPARHNLTVLLALAAGCGLNSTEIMALPVSSIRFDDDAVRVDVVGPDARTVVCLEVWEQDLRTVVDSPLHDFYLFVREERPTAANKYVPRYVQRSTNEGQAFQIERLRSTFIVTHLNAGTPLYPLMRALGMKDVRTFSRFRTFVKDQDEAGLVATFRQARA